MPKTSKELNDEKKSLIANENPRRRRDRVILKESNKNVGVIAQIEHEERMAMKRELIEKMKRKKPTGA
jgi:hypothetical protein